MKPDSLPNQSLLFKMFQTLLFLVIFAAFLLLVLERLEYFHFAERIRSLIKWCREKIKGNPLPLPKSLGRKNLHDDGTRSWDEEGESFLTLHYPNWKQLEYTIMVPDIFQGGNPLTQPKPNENAESKVFDLLKTFGNETGQPMFVVRARNFCELVKYFETGIAKTEWIQGDHDFVIIHRRHGLIFLEVKGRHKMKEVFKKGEEQIEKSKKAVESFLRKRFGKSKGINGALFRFPGFVVMPNCPRPDQSHENGIFKEDCENVNSFTKWWNKAIAEPAAAKPEFDSKLYEELVKKFVVFACSAPALNLQIDKTHEKILILTPDQLKSWYKSCPEQWISGPAGSGKTVLLIEKVKQIASDIIEGEHNEERILVLCCSVPLSVHLNDEVSDWFKSKFPSKTCPVHVKTYDSFIDKDIDRESVPGLSQKHKVKRRLFVERKFIERSPPEEHLYEHIFVDEGQDMVGNQWPHFLKKLHRRPVTCRRYHFWIMYDSNQHLQRTEKNRSFLDKITRNTSQLTEVLRNTKNIFSLSHRYYKGIYEGKITLGHELLGLEVEYDSGLTIKKENMFELVAHHVKKLRESKVEDKDIAVLVRTKRVRDNLIAAFKKEHELSCVTVENRLRERKNAIAVGTIKEFKGLESKVVVLCDPTYTINSNDAADRTREFLYTAVSRCFCYLIILSTHDGCERIKNAKLHVESVLRKSGALRSSPLYVIVLGSESRQRRAGGMENEGERREGQSRTQTVLQRFPVVRGEYGG